MKETTRQKIREYDNQYKKDNYKNYNVRVNKKTDADIIEYLSTIADKTNYIKSLIRADKEEKQK